MSQKFQLAAMGGTFDHFHAGHRHFIEFASQQAAQLLIGLTEQKLSNSKLFSQSIQSFEQRKKQLEQYCLAQNINARVVELTDVFGPTLGQAEVDCLVVTQLTEAGGAEINLRRTELGLSALPTFVCSMLHDQRNAVLNSTNIRAGVMDREGWYYLDSISGGITLTDAQKEQLHQPLGPLVEAPQPGTKIVVVGDVCLENFVKNNWRFDLGVFDEKSQRQKYSTALQADVTVLNPAGQITDEVVSVIDQLSANYFSKKTIMRVAGEEDLVAVPLVLSLPLGSRVYYGQPGEGMVEVEVTEEIKQSLSVWIGFEHLLKLDPSMPEQRRTF